MDSFCRGGLSRTVIAEAGFGEAFGHSLGHGVGLAVHENPRVGPRAKDVIEDGMAFTIEPGIYLPEFGVRSEIDAYMSESGPYATSPVQQEVVLIR